LRHVFALQAATWHSPPAEPRDAIARQPSCPIVIALAGACAPSSAQVERISVISQVKPSNDAPRKVSATSRQRHALRADDGIDFDAYTFCVLDELRATLKGCDAFGTPSWRYADPRTGLLDGAEWGSKPDRSLA